MKITSVAGGRGILIENPKNGERMILSLDEAEEMIDEMNAKRKFRRPLKDWANCPYEGHADDCDCKGEGGDR